MRHRFAPRFAGGGQCREVPEALGEVLRSLEVPVPGSGVRRALAALLDNRWASELPVEVIRSWDMCRYATACCLDRSFACW